MIATSHVIISGAIGVAVGTVTKSPVAAFTAGLLTHFICDAIPHWDHPGAPFLPNGNIVFTKKVFLFCVIDSIMAFLITLIIWIKFFHFPLITYYPLGALAGYLPDFVLLPPWWREQVQTIPGFKQIKELHIKIHDYWEKYFPMPEYWLLGSLTQLALVIPSLWFLLK